MKFSLAIVAFFLAGALAQIPQQQPHRPLVQNIQLAPGLMYVYQYQSRILTGIPMLADQYSGTEMKADIVLQPRSEGLVAMKLINIKLGNINDDVPANYEEDIQMVHRQIKETQRELSKPIRFLQVNGKVKQLEAEASEPVWSLNIKKSIINLFNLNLTPQKVIRAPRGNLIPKPISYQDLTYYGLYERGIAGICETIYEVKQMPDPLDPTPEKAFVLNVTKTRNYDNCLTQPSMVNENFDIRGCQAFCQKEKSQAVVPGYYPVPTEVSDPLMASCPCNKMMGVSPVDQYNHVKYNISTVGARPVIESLLSEGKIVYKTNGEKIMVISHQNATLVKMVPQQQMAVPSLQQPVRHTELEFRLPILRNPVSGRQPIMDIPMMHIFEEPNYKEWAKNLPKVFDQVADQIIAGEVSNSKNTLKKLTETTYTLSAMPVDMLEAMYKEIAQEGRSQEAAPREQIKRKLFLQVLPTVGTNQVAKFIKQLIEANLVSQEEAKSLVETLPENMFLPDVQTLDSYLQLTQSPRIKDQSPLFASTIISFAKMVNKACVRADQNPGDLPSPHAVPANKRNFISQMIVKPADPRSEIYQVKPMVPQYTKIIRPKRDVIQEQQTNTYSTQQQQFQQQQQRFVRGQEQQQRHQQQFGRQQQLPHQQYPQQQFGQRFQQQDDEFEDIIQQQICGEAEIVKYVHLLARFLVASETVQEKLAVVEALTHLQVPHVLPILEPYVSGRISPEFCPGYPVEKAEQRAEECNFLRTSVILALERMVFAQPQQVLALLLPVFRDVSEPYQVRVAAFSTLMWANPESQVLESIASQLHRENNQQVRSFVFTALKTNANLTLPCLQPIAQSARKVFEFLPEVQQGMHLSQSKIYDSYDEERQSGLLLHKEWIASNVSVLPRYAKIQLAQNEGPFMDNLITLSFHSKGFEKIVKRFLQPHGVLSGLFESLVGQKQQRRQEVKNLRQKRSVSNVEQALETLKQRLNFKHRGDEVPKAEIFTKIFGKTAQLTLDEEQIKEIMEQVEDTLQDWAEALADGYSGHLVKFFLPTRFDKMIPSEAGVPVGIYHWRPLLISLKVDNAKLEVSQHQKTIVPQMFNVSALITPQILYSSIIVVETYSTSRKMSFGTIVQKHYQAVLPMEVSVGVVQPKGLLRVSVLPSLPQQILHHKSEARTFIVPMHLAWASNTDNVNVGKVIKSTVQPWKHQQKIGQKMLGIGLNVELESENEWHDQLFWQTQYAKKNGLVQAFLQLLKNPSLKNRELNVRLEEDQKHPTVGLDMTFRYKTIADEEMLSDIDNSDSSRLAGESDSDVSSASLSSKSEDSSVTSQESDESTVNSKSTSRKQSRKQKLAKKLLHQMKEQLKKHPRSKVHMTNSINSDSSSSSSSSSSESSQMASPIFDYEDVMALINGKQIQEHNIHKIVKELIRKTEEEWKEERELEEQDQVEKARVPETIAHNLAITATLRGPRPTFFATNLVLVRTVDQRTFWLKLDSHIKTPVGVFSSQPQLLCTEGVLSFPQVPGEFYYDPTTLQDLKAKLSLKLGWGQECTSHGGIVVKGIMEKIPVEQQVTEKAFNWFYRQCKMDRSQGLPTSPACQKAILKESYLNQIVLDIKYDGVPKVIQNMTQKMDLAIKHQLYEYLQTNFVDVFNPEQQIRIKAQFYEKVPQVPMVDVLVQRPQEETLFKNVFVPSIRPFSAVKPMKDILMPLVSGIKPAATCVVMEKGVQTFDNVTLELPENQCQYLIAMDCSPQEKFAIFASQLDQEARTKIVHVNVQGQEIKMMPPQQQNLIQVIVDGKEQALTPKKPLSFCTAQDCVRMYLRKSPSEAVAPIAVIEAPQQDIKVLYDGKNVKVEAGPRYTGKTCGLCSNNDHETEDELVGPNQCIYQEVEDFVNSYALSGKNCEKVAEPIGQVRCPQGIREQQGTVKEITRMQTRGGIHGQTTVVKGQTVVQTGPGKQVPACQFLRTQTIIRDQMICFSTRPVVACGQCRAQSLQQLQVEFHCLPRNSPFTKQLMAEAQIKVLSQLMNKRVDLTQQLQVPTSCVPVYQ